MHKSLSRNPRVVIGIALAFALAACHKTETRPQPQPSPATPSIAPKPVHVSKPKPAPAKPATAPKAATAHIPMVASEKNTIAAPTGIDECDDYLGNYKACHSVLGTQFTDIDAQLTTLRSSILDTARDQGVDAAKAKCEALVKQRDETLNGRSCK